MLCHQLSQTPAPTSTQDTSQGVACLPHTMGRKYLRGFCCPYNIKITSTLYSTNIHDIYITSVRWRYEDGLTLPCNDAVNIHQMHTYNQKRWCTSDLQLLKEGCTIRSSKQAYKKLSPQFSYKKTKSRARQRRYHAEGLIIDRMCLKQYRLSPIKLAKR